MELSASGWNSLGRPDQPQMNTTAAPVSKPPYPLAEVAMKVQVSPQLFVTMVTFTDLPGASVPLAGVTVD
jgi:hypothetical protein